jgi:anti-sigma factor RsiW
MSTKIPEDLLTAYVNNELEGADRARVEQAIARDAILAQRVARQRALRERQPRMFGDALNEPRSGRLSSVHELGAPSAPAQIIDLARARAARARRAEPRRTPISTRAAIVASLGIGLCAGLLIEYAFSLGAPMEFRDGAMLARGSLERALNQELASTISPARAVHIGLSFRTRSGIYCRIFELEGRHALSGLACKEQQQWRIANLVAADAGRSPPGPLPRGAVSSSLPAALQQAVNERLSGAPLDASEEAVARSKDWH